MFFYLLQVDASEVKPWIENYASTIGTVVIILLFIAERLLARKEKKDERNSTWYFSVIVQPNLNVINDFFQNYSRQAVLAHADIANTIFSNTSAVIQMKAVHFNTLQNLIKDFDFEFLMIVYGYEVSQHSALIDIVNEMHDDVVGILDREALNNITKENILQLIRNQKSVFFDVLSRGII